MGRLEEETQAAHSRSYQKTYYEYNNLGKLVNKNSLGATIQYTYNKDGKLHKIESSNCRKELQISNRYSYDRKDNITSAYSLYGKSVLRTYTPFNQVEKETIKDGEGTYSLEYAYDRKGRLKSILLPDQSKITYTYDALLGREVTRISPTGDILYTHTYDTYDSQGRLTSEKHIGYVGSHEHTYNLNGQKTANKNDLFSEKYLLDALGRLTEIQGEKIQQYSYNDLSQLVTEKDHTHHYDSLNNRIQNNNDELIYNALNQLTSHANTEFSYDAQGNLLRKALDGEETVFESNSLSQLISIQKPDKTALTFSYDPFGRLLVEKHLDVKGTYKKTLSTTRYLYVGYQEIGTLSSTGAVESLKIPGLCGDELSPKSIAFEINEQTYVPLHDFAGNVSHLVDPQDLQILERYEYTAFGQVFIFNGDGSPVNVSVVGNPWQFSEKRIDEKSGLILFGLRIYDPSIGRWISQDPAGGFDGPNPYAYLQNNPLNHIDLFGLSTDSVNRDKFIRYMFGEIETHCFCEKHRTCKRGGDIGKTAGTQLPTITHNYTFESHNKDFRSVELFIADCYDDSCCYDLSGDGLPDLPNDLGIGFINGIWNDFAGSKEGATYVSRLAGGYNVHGVYNATHGQMDLQECQLGLDFIATEPVRQLHKMWNSHFERKPGNSKFLMICHSQGAIHVRNALLDYPPELRKRILVVAVAPVAYIYKKSCGNLVHYRAEWWRDFVPRLDKGGAKREKDSTITLTSHSDAGVFDHEFMSPTYQNKIKEHILNYINSRGNSL